MPSKNWAEYLLCFFCIFFCAACASETCLQLTHSASYYEYIGKMCMKSNWTCTNLTRILKTGNIWVRYLALHRLDVLEDKAFGVPNLSGLKLYLCWSGNRNCRYFYIGQKVLKKNLASRSPALPAVIRGISFCRFSKFLPDWTGHWLRFTALFTTTDPGLLLLLFWQTLLEV